MTKNRQKNAPTIAALTLTVTRGVMAGWIAGIPQVVLSQIVGALAGSRERADIGPRFMHRAAQQTGRHLSRPMRWLLGGVFHFEYAAMWGATYALLTESIGWRRVPPPVAGALLGAAIYTAAFSGIGAGTQTGAEREPEERKKREWAVHLTAPLSFALPLAYAYRWLREQW